MSTVNVSGGSARNSSHVHEHAPRRRRRRSEAPLVERRVRRRAGRQHREVVDHVLAGRDARRVDLRRRRRAPNPREIGGTTVPRSEAEGLGRGAVGNRRCRRPGKTSSGRRGAASRPRCARPDRRAQAAQRGRHRRAARADERRERAVRQRERQPHALRATRAPSARRAPRAAREGGRRRAGAGAIASWKARLRARRTWRRLSVPASTGQRARSRARRGASSSATRVGSWTCQATANGSGSNWTSSSHGRRMSPAPRSSVVVRPANRCRASRRPRARAGRAPAGRATARRAAPRGRRQAWRRGRPTARVAASRSRRSEALAELGIGFEQRDERAMAGHGPPESCPTRAAAVKPGRGATARGCGGTPGARTRAGPTSGRPRRGRRARRAAQLAVDARVVEQLQRAVDRRRRRGVAEAVRDAGSASASRASSTAGRCRCTR